MKKSDDIAIVLTAAVIVSHGSTAVEAVAERRRQYLTALRFYAGLAPVYFLENSGYDIQNDPDFVSVPNVQLRPVPAQEDESRGKGYREFHALDIWYDGEPNPPRRFLKITGRYLVGNISELLNECRQVREDILLFDLYQYDKVALTSVFSVSWADYGQYLRGLYHEANDRTGNWIERLTYSALLERGAPTQSFRVEPDVGGISGSSGRAMQAGRFKFFVRQATRTLNRLFDRKFLSLRGTAFEPMKEFIRKKSDW